ncbi:uncharacterized protein TNCV_3582971 [Trichonephila clavipes]|nr:uncharacterized protein TNCV_3582971 [Trichonephila clavipes]
MVWGSIGYHSRTSLVRIADTLNSQRYISEVLESVVLPYLQGLVSHISTGQCVITRGTHCRKVLRQSPDLIASLAGSFSGSFADRKHVVHGCSFIYPDYTPCCLTRSTLATCGSFLICCTPRIHPKSL